MAFLVVEYYARNSWTKHRLKRIMMNSKCFFFFKFDSRSGLEAILEGGPWSIHKSPIILKKWSMDTRLPKEEFTRIPIWVKLHDVPIQVFKEDTTAPNKGATYVGNTSKSSSMLKTTEDDEEDVENVHDESANLIQNTKAGGSSFFTAAAG
ncbi:zinc knuckle CX2CX4HX4C containing protein [Tanacetum coccineum]